MSQPVSLAAVEALVAADAVRRAVTRLARQLRHLRADHGVSAGRLSVLGRLHRAGRPLTAVDLAREERLQPQSLTRIIADLDAKNLVARRPDEADRRHILIEITPAGRALLVRDAKAQNAWLASVIAERLTEAEREILRVAMGLMDRLGEAESAGAISPSMPESGGLHAEDQVDRSPGPLIPAS